MMNRVTGELIDAGEIYAEDWRLPPLHPRTSLLKYMDLSKFESMMRTRRFYVRRADKFVDPLEGTISEKKIHGTSRSDRAFAQRIKLASSYEEQAEARKGAKATNFVGCFTINDRPDAEMWNAYTSSSNSVMIATTVERLHWSLPSYVSGGAVRYVKATEPRSEFDQMSLFFYKDEAFKFEREYRVVANFMHTDGPNPRIHYDRKEDFGRTLPVNLNLLLRRVVPHPEAPAETVANIRRLVTEALPVKEWLPDGNIVVGL